MASKLLVEIATYNTNLQGHYGLPQDLVDWLAPTLKVSSFLAHGRQAPDIVAVGFQELLPLPLGLAGLSRKVIDSRDALIRSQIEEHAPNKESYMLVAKIVNVGVALLVYVRDEEIGSRVCDVQSQWTGCGPAGMGNKGAVGVRFRLKGNADSEGETFTFVNAHLTAHPGNLEYRVADYKYIVGTLLFPPPPSSSAFKTKTPTTMYDTSHLFFFGDFNFRLILPSRSSITHSSDGNGSLETQGLLGPTSKEELYEMLKDDVEREKLKELDELSVERRKGRAFVGLHEGEFWQFKCSYKYEVNEVDRYSKKRLPAWTDRVMYASYFDTPDKSSLEPVLYTSIPSYTTSDHKPVVALLKVPTHTLTSNSTSHPSSSPSSHPPPPHRIPIPTSSQFTPTPDPYYALKRYTGRALDRLLGGIATLLWFVGLGNAALGALNFVFGVVAWKWLGFGSRFGFGGNANGYGSGNESGGVEVGGGGGCGEL